MSNDFLEGAARGDISITYGVGLFDVPLLERRYNHGYTPDMKTAISIPDKVFEAAEKAAKRLGVSRSELYVSAIQEYLAQHSDENVTAELNNIYSNDEADSQLDPGLGRMQASSLNQTKW